MRRAEKIYRFLIYILPGVLFFSYYPLMHFGSSESMNFEISLPLIWLVLFDVLVVWLMGKRKMWLRGWKKRWVWLLLPVWLTVSVLWSLNAVRGVLTVGILWLLYLAVYGMWRLRGLMDEEFRGKFWKWFFGASLVTCVWCWVQCVLDLCGISREYTLMCAGCTYEMFGFPHPNGMAIEPQFMGNLLLAPAIMAGWLMLKNRKYLLIFFVLTATLFLTFSRGAIYAFLIAMLVMTVWQIVLTKKWKVLSIWAAVVLAFLFTLNTQGIMAQMSATNDTYVTGVAKVLNHLTLGVVDVRGETETTSQEEVLVDIVYAGEETQVSEAVENEAAFDGYVAESTDTRLRLSGAAVEVWGQNFSSVMFGVGLGGAGQALYVNGLSPAPKEIVQNQYASLLLETGLVGIGLLILTLVLVVRVVLKSPWRVVILSLIIAYGVTLCFFSGLPNALQIYLMPGVLLAIGAVGMGKKLVEKD
ncbi:MAG: O-antigen ligase family protein [Candidatus Saccharibacteria bacterium]|nr:O-antigen ligase family protein [Candidatus Saccharibacteria bacterium]